MGLLSGSDESNGSKYDRQAELAEQVETAESRVAWSHDLHLDMGDKSVRCRGCGSAMSIESSPPGTASDQELHKRLYAKFRDVPCLGDHNDPPNPDEVHFWNEKKAIKAYGTMLLRKLDEIDGGITDE